MSSVIQDLTLDQEVTGPSPGGKCSAAGRERREGQLPDTSENSGFPSWKFSEKGNITE